MKTIKILLQILKEYWWVILFAMALPLIINMFYLLDAPHEIIAAPKEWTNFWCTYISAIATALTAIIAYKALRETQKASAPFIGFRIEYLGNNSFNLTVFNIGKAVAKNVEIFVEYDTKELTNAELKEFSGSQVGTYTLFPNERVTINLLKENYYTHNDKQLSLVFGTAVMHETYESLKNYLFDKNITLTCKYNEEVITGTCKLMDLLNGVRYETI